MKWKIMYATDEFGCTCLAVWDYNIKTGFIGSPICKISPIDLVNEQDQKNATLIAAAPEMLELLKECLIKLDNKKSNDWEAIKVINLKNKIFNLLQVLNNKPVNL